MKTIHTLEHRIKLAKAQYHNHYGYDASEQEIELITQKIENKMQKEQLKRVDLIEQEMNRDIKTDLQINLSFHNQSIIVSLISNDTKRVFILSEF